MPGSNELNLAMVVDMMESFVDVHFGAMSFCLVNFYNVPAARMGVYKGCGEVVRDDFCRRPITGPGSCHHNAEELGDVLYFYNKVPLMVVDSSVDRPVKVFVHDAAEQLTGVSALEFDILDVSAQIKAWRHITLQTPLCKAWISTEAGIAKVRRLEVQTPCFSFPFESDVNTSHEWDY